MVRTAEDGQPAAGGERSARPVDTALADDALRCDVVVTHPLFGPIFGCAGDFRVPAWR